MPHPFHPVFVPKTGSGTIAFALGLSNTHDTAAMIRDGDPGGWDQAYTFAFVRNPWDHAVSWYLYCSGYRTASFPEWIGPYHQGARLSAGHDALREDDWITDHAGVVLVNELHDFDHLGRGYVHVCRSIGRQPVLPLPERNVAADRVSRGPYADYYDRESRDLVGQCNAELIRLMGYRFGERLPRHRSSALLRPVGAPLFPSPR